jgi:transposase-like protein
MIRRLLARWRQRRESAAIAVALQAENDELRAENKRLTDALQAIASAAVRIAHGERVFLDTWAGYTRKTP